MSEYQYYEFLAIDRPLGAAEQAAVRSLSSRARITGTSFVNEYHWGDFRGDPNRLMERYYDAHLYVANWGTHRVMLRLPRDLLDPHVVEDYCVDEQLTARFTDKSIVLDFTSADHAGEFDFNYDAQALLSAIVGIRSELAAGDLRPLYVGWLAAYGAWERDEDAFDGDADDDLEPPVPPGLNTLTAAQRALADFLRLDDDLLAIAAQTSPPLADVTDDPGELAAWVTRLPVAEKNRLLGRVVHGDAARVRMELLRRFRRDTAPTIPVPARRTVADLLDDTACRRADREHRLAAQRAEDEARRETARAVARERRLDELARQEDTAWSRVDAMIATRKPAEYDAAVTLLTDLQALAEREDRHHTFTLRTTALRQTHPPHSAVICGLLSAPPREGSKSDLQDAAYWKICAGEYRSSTLAYARGTADTRDGAVDAHCVRAVRSGQAAAGCDGGVRRGSVAPSGPRGRVDGGRVLLRRRLRRRR